MTKDMMTVVLKDGVQFRCTEMVYLDGDETIVYARLMLNDGGAIEIDRELIHYVKYDNLEEYIEVQLEASREYISSLESTAVDKENSIYG